MATGYRRQRISRVLELQETISSSEGITREQEIDNDSIEFNLSNDGISISERASSEKDSGDVKRFMLCTVKMGDRKIRSEWLLEVSSESVGIGIFTDRTTNHIQRLRRSVKNHVNNSSEREFMLVLV